MFVGNVSADIGYIGYFAAVTLYRTNPGVLEFLYSHFPIN